MEPNQNATGARIVILTECQQVFHSVTTLQENQRKQSELPATRHPGFEMQILTLLFCSTRLRADTYCWVCCPEERKVTSDMSNRSGFPLGTV